MLFSLLPAMNARISLPASHTLHIRGRRSIVCYAEASQPIKPLVVVGSVNADLVLSLDRLPAAGETLGANNLSTFAGGKGANQAAAAARLDYPTHMVGQVGRDGNADFLRSSLAECGVSLDHLATVDGPSGSAVIFLFPDGENSIIIVGGANREASFRSFSAATSALIQSAGILLLQREVDEEVNVAASEIAHSSGVQVVLDCGGVDRPIGPELLKNVTILSPNETELARLTGLPTETAAEAETAAWRLLSEEGGLVAVLVKRGSQGCLLLQRGVPGSISQAAISVPRVVDTTGAGDCFTAAYAVALLQGRSPPLAMKFAVTAAALCVQKAGAMPSMPSRKEVLQLLELAQ